MTAQKTLEASEARTQRFLKSLHELSEYTLTLEVIIPLLKALGYSRVDYHGGPTEEGKDIIAWRQDEFGEPYLAVIQVKKYRLTKRAADKRSFSEVINQLSQACEKMIPALDSSLRRPSAVLFITPFPIATSILQSRIEAYAELRRTHIRIIDGLKLAELVLQKTPSAFSRFCGSGPAIAVELAYTLNNDALLNALSATIRRDIRVYYTNIDFALGRLTTRLFLFSRPQKGPTNLLLPANDWQALKRIAIQTRNVFGLQILKTSEEVIEAKYAFDNNKYTLLSEKHESLSRELSRARRRVDIVRQRAFLLVPRDDGSSSPNSRLLARMRVALGIDSNAAQLRSCKRLIDPIGEPEFQQTTEAAELSAAFEELVSELALACKTDKLLSSLPKLGQEPLYQVSIDADELWRFIENKRDWIRSQVEGFNRKPPTTSVLRAFLTDCESLFEHSAYILKNEHIAKLALLTDKMRLITTHTKYRLTLPVLCVFDTGLNIAVLGEAGAGKTTSLQMYTQQILNADTGRRHAIYVPLNRAIGIWKRAKTNVRVRDEPTFLSECLIHYLRVSGIHLSESEFASLCANGKTILLLDGIDEAIKIAPWLLGAIRELAARFPQTQVITSSRMSGDYLEKIPFMGITLLPFTKTQQINFCRLWFGKEGKEHISQIEKHLHVNRHLSEIISNPLQATLLCVLQENGVPLPNSETRLYEERMRLLLGHYDVHKQVNRMRCQRRDLELVARKISFALHRGSRRESHQDDLEALWQDSFSGMIGKRTWVLGVRELIDPCNILVPMTEDGKIGFGHLRYQEYLAASEILINRSIAVEKYLAEDWWKGVLVLMAKMAEGLDWLISRCIASGLTIRELRTLLVLVRCRPKRERHELLATIRSEFDPDYGVGIVEEERETEFDLDEELLACETNEEFSPWEPDA